MNVKEIRELADLVARRGLASLELEHEGFRLRIEGPRPAVREAPPSPMSPYPAVPMSWEEKAPRAEAPASAAPASGPEAGSDVHVVTSPIVGTFYRAPNPEAEPFVKIGDTVEKGATLCIVEAMKLMNEIEADVAGTVVEAYPKNGQPVEFGEKLFGIRPS